MWWRMAKISALRGFGGGIILKREPVVDDSQDAERVRESAERAMRLRKTDPNEMSIEDKLRSTPNRGGIMHTPPRVNVDQTMEASIELIGDKNKSPFRPDQHEGPWNDQPPINPDISKNSYPANPPR